MANTGTNGELKQPMCNLSVKPNTTAVDDSGTESGEEVNQKILVQVQGALANLESALPALDPLRRSSVVELLTKLQTSLKLSTENNNNNNNKPTPPPRKCWNKKIAARPDRHTVGVSSEELQDARRWLEENGYTGVAASADTGIDKPVSACSTPRSYDASSTCKTFRPVRFVPPPPKRTHNNMYMMEDYIIPEPSKQSLQNGSFTCPPAQHVVVENVDAAVESQRRRSEATSNCDTTDSSSDDDRHDVVSDDEDDCDDDDEEEDDGHRSVSSSAQRLLQIASCSDLPAAGRKFRQGKRAKLKRGPGSDVGGEHSSGDEYLLRNRPKQQPPVSGSGVPAFEPKTANDQKYLALLRQAKEDEATAQAPTTYNPLHGKLQGNWSNRFGRIKTTFEKNRQQQPPPPPSSVESPKKKAAKTFWHDVCKCPSDDNIVAHRPRKITPFAPAVHQLQVRPGDKGFSHGVRSAFRPVAQKTAAVASSTEQHQSKPIYPKPAYPKSGYPKPTYEKRLPLYNSSVTTAHRPFVPAVYAPPMVDKSVVAVDSNNYSNPPAQWNTGMSPGSASDWTSSRSTSPNSTVLRRHSPQPSTAVISRVMGSPQTASIVKNKTNHMTSLYPSPSSSSLNPSPSSSVRSVPSYSQSSPSSGKLAPSYLQQSSKSSAKPTQYPPSSEASRPPPTKSPHMVSQQRSPTSSPVRMPSVLQKSESWHQMILGQSRAATRSPLSLAVSAGRPAAPYEASRVPPRRSLKDHEIAQKQNMVRQHLQRVPESFRRASPRLVKLNDDIDKVDDTFESLFKEATSKTCK